MIKNDPAMSRRNEQTKSPPIFTENLSAFALNDLGLVAAGEGDHVRAVEKFRLALREADGHAFIYSNYALSLRDLGRFTEAIRMLQKAIMIDPNNSVLLFNLGNIQYEVGAVREALASFEIALRNRPGFPELLCNYALVALGAQEIALAQRLARRGLTEAPQDHPLRARFVVALARIDITSGHIKEALARLEPFIDVAARDEIIEEYIRALSSATPEDLSSDSLRHVETILNNKLVPPERIARTVWRCLVNASGLYETPATQALPPLALLLMSNTVIPDVETEEWLSRQRQELLKMDPQRTLSDAEVIFFSALAQQCFLKNYLFDDSNADLPDLEKLGKQIDDNLEKQREAPDLWLLQYACREPLVELRYASRLLETMDRSPQLAAVFQQQIETPLTERLIEPTIPSLFNPQVFQDEVSDRYSAHPYPQWTWPGLLHRQESFNIYLTKRLTHTNFEPVDAAVDVLVAGCGTGRHSHVLARMLENSNIKAIDISRSSLAFAKRQAINCGLTNVEYIHADIMNLDKWSERFDVIECAGVLHHLNDPDAGLRILLNLLRSGGMLLLGLYSRRARMPLSALRSNVQQKDQSNSLDAIHEARRIAQTEPAYASVLRFHEFYSLSGCLDLILHPREQTYDLSEVGAMLDRNGLVLRGLELSESQRTLFRMRHRSLEKLQDLTLWDSLEREHPDIFAGMYQFWVQKMDT